MKLSQEIKDKKIVFHEEDLKIKDIVKQFESENITYSTIYNFVRSYKKKSESASTKSSGGARKYFQQKFKIIKNFCEFPRSL